MADSMDTHHDTAFARYRERSARGVPDPELMPAGLGTLVLDEIKSAFAGEISRLAWEYFAGDMDAAADAVAEGDASASRSVPPVLTPGHVRAWLRKIHDNAARDQLSGTKTRHRYEAAAATEAAILDDTHGLGTTGSGLGGGRADAGLLGPILKGAFPESSAEPEDLKYAVEDRDDFMAEDGTASEFREGRGLGYSTRATSRQEVAMLKTPEDEAIALQEAEHMIASLGAAPEVSKTIEAVALGSTTAEIAAERGVSVSTVERQRRDARGLAQRWAPAERPAIVTAADRAAPATADSDAERERIADALKPAWRLRAGVSGPLGLPPAPVAAPPKGPMLASFLNGGWEAMAAPPPCLTDAELREVTGKERPSAQARVLEFMAVPFRRRPDGTLLVLRVHVEVPPASTRPEREPALRLPTPRAGVRP